MQITVDTPKINIEKALYVLAAIIGIIFIITLIKKIFYSPLDEYEKIAGTYTGGGGKTYSDIEYQTMAKTLYRAMKGWGTDEDTVERVIKMLNTKQDWYALIRAYGTATDDDMTLTDHLLYDLEDNPDTLVEVRKHLNSIGVVI